MKVKQERIDSIDVAKGIGILLIIIGHLGAIRLGMLFNCCYILYIFHVPLFFFISGIFLKPYSKDTAVFEISKKVSRLIKPYYIFGFFACLLAMSISSDFCLKNQLIGYLLMFRRVNGEACFTGALWFLPALFANIIICSFIIRYRIKYCFILSLIFVFFAYVLGYYKVCLPLNLEVSFLFIPLTLSAFFYWRDIIRFSKLGALIFLPCSLSLLFCYKLFGISSINYYMSSFGMGGYFLCFVRNMCSVLFIANYQ